jgi:glycerol-3-phosphate dehydrogenase
LAQTRSLRLVKGSHIVVRKLFDHPLAYIFQSPDKRIIFAIPYEDQYTLIGTTDVEHHGAPGTAQIDQEEIEYLCAQASRYFAQPVHRDQVVWSYSGVRPLLDDAAGDPSAVTRDYALELDGAPAPLLSVWGGKITTFRKLAEEAADQLCRAIGHKASAWTRGQYLPGGDLSSYIGPPQRPDLDFERFLQALAQRYPWLPQNLRLRWARAYGARIEHIIGTATQLPALGAELAPGLFEAELRYLQDNEWATCAQDVLWRRSKLGLHTSPAQHEAVQRWFEAQPHPAAWPDD